MLTLSYLGAVRSIPNYNVMGLAKASLEANVRFLAADLGPQGIRVNGISAGPIKTLSGAGVGGFRKMLNYVAKVAPLRRNVSTRGCRQCRHLPVLGHGRRSDRRNHVRGQRLQHRRHEFRRRGRRVGAREFICVPPSARQSTSDTPGFFAARRLQTVSVIQRSCRHPSAHFIDLRLAQRAAAGGHLLPDDAGRSLDLEHQVAVVRIAGNDSLHRGHFDAGDVDETGVTVAGGEILDCRASDAPMPLWHPEQIGVKISACSWVSVGALLLARPI